MLLSPLSSKRTFFSLLYSLICNSLFTGSITFSQPLFLSSLTFTCSTPTLELFTLYCSFFSPFFFNSINPFLFSLLFSSPLLTPLTPPPFLQVDRRWAWFRRLLRTVDSKFSTVCPPHWRLPLRLCFEFTERTKVLIFYLLCYVILCYVML